MRSLSWTPLLSRPVVLVTSLVVGLAAWGVVTPAEPASAAAYQPWSSYRQDVRSRLSETYGVTHRGGTVQFQRRSPSAGDLQVTVRQRPVDPTTVEPTGPWQYRPWHSLRPGATLTIAAPKVLCLPRAGELDTVVRTRHGRHWSKPVTIASLISSGDSSCT